MKSNINKPENSPLEREFRTGFLDDIRDKKEKAKDFSSRELFGAPPALKWPDWDTWRTDKDNREVLETVSVQDQGHSSSCMAQALSVCLAINNWREEGKYRRMSPRSVYPYRRNKPDEGMFADDVGNIATERGIVFESLLPSDGMNEEQMNSLSDQLPSFREIGKIYKAGLYIWVPPDIDSLATILSQRRPALITVRFGSGEWAKTTPVVLDVPTPYGHGIAALPNAFFLYNKKKSVLIQDSWGIKTGIDGRRIVSEDWFKKGRVKSALWFEDLQNLTLQNRVLDKPRYKFTRNLPLGATGSDVAMLQRCLGYLKDANGYLFPLTQSPTGYYGGITRDAVKRFQALHGIVTTGEVYQITRAELNTIFA